MPENIFEEISAAIKAISSRKDIYIQLIYDSQNTDTDAVFQGWITATTLNGIKPEIITLNGADTEPSTFHAELSTIPMFDTIRLLRVRHCDTLLKKIKSNNTIYGYFERDLKNTGGANRLILEIDESKIPSAWSWLEKISLIYSNKTIKEKDLPGYIQKRAEAAGYKMGINTAQLLVSRCAMDRNKSLNALDRLMLYTIHEKTITSEDVEQGVTDAEGDRHFKIIDLVAERKISAALRELSRHHLDDGLFLLNGLISWFSNSVRYRMLKSSGLSSREIHETLGMRVDHDYIFRKNEERFNHINRNYSSGNIPLILRNLIRADKDLKTGGNPQVVMTVLIGSLRDN